MQTMIDRLKAEHRQMGQQIRDLILRVGRRPASRGAIEETLVFLDGPLALHEATEIHELSARLGASLDPLNAILEVHAHISTTIRRLDKRLAAWASDPDEAEALACDIEDLLHIVLRHFQEEERQVYSLTVGRSRPDRGATLEAEA